MRRGGHTLRDGETNACRRLDATLSEPNSAPFPPLPPNSAPCTTKHVSHAWIFFCGSNMFACLGYKDSSCSLVLSPFTATSTLTLQSSKRVFLLTFLLKAERG
jgi:hypothetical protein